MRDRGNSFANGPVISGGSGAGITGYRSWRAGWQAPEPVTRWTLTESDRYT